MTKQYTPSVAFITLGCPKNEVDSDKMRAAVAGSGGYAVADDPHAAEVVVVNTCSFIQEATEESIRTILEVTTEWLPERPERRIIVAGCMPSRYGEELSESLSEVHAFLPVAQEDALLETLEQLTGVPAQGSAKCLRAEIGPSAYLQVSDGCHRACAFCTIPSIRGPYRSRLLDDIVSEARELVAGGARELILIGQDVSAYGRDLPGSETLADVVRVVAAVEGVKWLRLMYVQPDGVTDELLDVMATTPNVCHYLDIPLQHASERVLRSMRRRGSGEEFLSLVGRVRAAMPDAALRTTMITGFPGETRSDVDELVRFIQSARFDYIGVFAYSPEDGTEAASLADQVPLRTRRRRAQRVRDAADEIGFERVARHVGSNLEVLVEGYDPDEGSVIGRWRGQAPEIDGLVLLDTGERGDLLEVSVVDTLGYDLEGVVRQ